MKHPVDGYKIHGMIEMPDEGAETIRDFLLHLYPGSEFTVSKDNLVKLVEFAHKIDQTSLTKACTDFALQEAKRDPFALLEISGRNGLMEVFQASSSTILMDFDSNRSKEAYIALSPDIRVLVSIIDQRARPSSGTASRSVTILTDLFRILSLSKHGVNGRKAVSKLSRCLIKESSITRTRTELGSLAKTIKTTGLADSTILRVGSNHRASKESLG